MPASSERAAEPCPECGAPLIEGRIAVPVLGSLRFVYRIGTNEIGTEVSAMMCGSCGLVRLQAKDPELIRRAERAGRLGSTRRFKRAAGSDAPTDRTG
jgi:hypothetical protein